MPKGVEVQLFDSAGTALSSLTNLQVAWLDVPEVKDFIEFRGIAAAMTTNGSGWLRIDLDNFSGLAVGEDGFLIVYQKDVSDYKDSLVFASKMTVATISSGQSLSIPNSWVRNPAWLTMPTILSTDEKFAGLHAVYPEGNFCALSAVGNYTVNWGDGSGDINVASGVVAERNIAWADAPATSDVGIADARACTFTDTGDTVNLTAHGYLNGAIVAFNTIVTTTGISTYTSYYVVGRTADTFQVADTAGGSARALTTNGSGSVYTPQYRQVIVTVVPNASTITELNLHRRHSSLSIVYASLFLDITVSFSQMWGLRVAVENPGAIGTLINFNLLERFSLLNSASRQFQHLFYNCRSLGSVEKIVPRSGALTSSAVTFTDAGDLVNLVAHGLNNGDPVQFSSIVSTTGLMTNVQYYVRNATADTFQVSAAPIGSVVALTTDGSGTALIGTSFSNLFDGSISLATIPLFDTSAGYNFSFMARGCASLAVVPLYDTSAGVTFSSMFQGCRSLRTIPLLNTAAGIFFASMLNQSDALVAVPLLNLSAGTALSQMFTNCGALQKIPAFNLAAATDISSMFSGCTTLEEVGLFSAPLATNWSSTLSSCSVLKEIPLLDTAAATNLSFMFSGCSSLQQIPLLNTAACTNFSFLFNNCLTLAQAPLLNTAAGTTFTNMFSTSTASLTEGALSGTTRGISYANQKLSAAALDRIYTALGTAAGAQTITVTGNYGVTGDDPTIATAKGWTVTG